MNELVFVSFPFSLSLIGRSKLEQENTQLRIELANAAAELAAVQHARQELEAKQTETVAQLQKLQESSRSVCVFYMIVLMLTCA